MTGQPDTGPLDVREPDEGHDCRWQVVGSQLRGSGSLLDQARTLVLLRCETCRMPLSVTLAGHWTARELTGPGYAMADPPP